MHEHKKDFKYCCRKSKRNFLLKEASNLNELKNKSPREFWKKFKTNKSTEIGENIDPADFYEHFKTLSSDIVIEEDNEVINFLSDFDSGTHNYDKSYDELDVPFTQGEILSSIKLLSTNKSCSFDNIIYEYFKETENLLIEPLTLLFNYILDKQTFPKSWSKGVVFPVIARGDNLCDIIFPVRQ